MVEHGTATVPEPPDEIAPPPAALVAHHFDSFQQQHDASVLGMWVFLVTELMLFGSIISVYGLYWLLYTPAFKVASHELDVFWGTVNTCVLLCSSLSMAMAVHAAELRRKTQLIRYLALTMVLGSAFLGIKFYEYYHKWHEHLVPITGFDYHHPAGWPPESRMFLNFYFGMTSLHAAHMLIGLGIMLVLLVKALRGHYTRGDFIPVETAGLYWHFVDIVWIFLFPFLYLVERAQ